MREDLTELFEGLLRVTLNRPGRLNALTDQMGFDRIDASDRAEREDQVRVVIGNGAFPGFCAELGLGGACSRKSQNNGPGRPRGRREFAGRAFAPLQHEGLEWSAGFLPPAARSFLFELSSSWPAGYPYWVFFLVATLVLGFFAMHRLVLGYPRPARDLVVLGRGEAAFLTAAAETLFPATEGMPLSGGEADLPGYADTYLADLPSKQRRLIRALFLLFEQGTLLWPARGLGAFRRFSSLSPEQRLAVLRGWEGSRISLRRMAFSALKAVLVLGYLGHPQSLSALGLSAWSIESPICEADLLYPPIGQAASRIPYTRADITLASEAKPLRDRERIPQ